MDSTVILQGKMWRVAMFRFSTNVQTCRIALLATVVATAAVNVAGAEPLSLFEPAHRPVSIFDGVLHDQRAVQPAAPPMTDELPGHLRRQVVDFTTTEARGTIIIDTPKTYLYYVLGDGRAIRYGIGVGRDGFTWSGVQAVARKAEWPDWIPPSEMLVRQPYLPRFMAGGPGNPLGARAIYLGDTIYRIHGTNQPATIGGHVSSGCIRMANEDVIDLYGRVEVGTKVVVLPAATHREIDQTAQSRSGPVPFSMAALRPRPVSLR
jgi:lipoprotein-anchoring transpeptidase ErfK/SrfK